MKPLRILVVDDSAVMRKVLSNLLASDPEMVVAGTASNGKQALARILEVKPDLLTLDIEMPGMDGLQTLVEIRKLHAKLPVIMFSRLTERGGAATLDALAKGASDYITKPNRNGGPAKSRLRVQEELIRKIKCLCAAREPQTETERAARPPLAERPLSRVDVVAIGASTGGPGALTELLPQLPASFPAPIVIVQHMPPMFTRLLADRLDTLCRLRVQEGREGQTLQPGQVWIAPGDHHMTVARNGAEWLLGIQQGARENSCRPAVDVLFRSAARAYGANVLAVVLTGMGADGTRGCAAVREAGGAVIVQDEASSVVWGMPGSVVNASLADGIYPLGGIARQLVRRVSLRRPAVPGPSVEHYA